ncbi:hypothetical protein [Sulfuricurvum sp.]|uniref:hypothetical protein n=1 Tax=Sulfuricurvum sp. TaxID=2025608 RepID=UPI002E325DA2|nr:hypothetical protein [Sulfuricurvum sp.]HEX5329975.1 hypothetical protein [Sulfuricurvum sp.]
MRHTLSLSLTLLLLGGCAANRMGVTPSQNTNLQAISPSGTASSEGGAMQRSLDRWLKEEWNPLMASQATENTKQQSDGTVVTTKTEPTKMSVTTQTADGKTLEKTTSATQITTTTKAPDGSVTTKTEVVPLDEDNTPFTLQKYVDKWKDYLGKKEKMNEGQPKEPANWEKLQKLPGIGK